MLNIEIAQETCWAYLQGRGTATSVHRDARLCHTQRFSPSGETLTQATANTRNSCRSPHHAFVDRFAKQVAEEAEVARLQQEQYEAEKKAEAARLSKKKKGKK